MKPAFSFSLIFISLSIFYYLIIEIVYFHLIYHADNLYLPLISQDLLAGYDITQWFLPPSTYLFPDGIIVLGLHLILPLQYVPRVYGMVNLILISLSTYIFFSKRLGNSKAAIGLLIILFFIMVTSVAVGESGRETNPFGYLFANAHHTSLIYVNLLLVSIRKPDNQLDEHLVDYIRKVCLLLLLISVYTSDRFFLIFLLSANLADFFSHRKSLYYLNLPILIITVILGEIFHQCIGIYFKIPSSFCLLMQNLSASDLQRNSYLLIHYYYDFIKLYFHQCTLIISIPLSLSPILLFFYRKFYSSFDLLFITILAGLSIFFLGFVGRFGFPHHYPIRYLIPLFYFVLIYICLFLLRAFPILSKQKCKLRLLSVFLFLFVITGFIFFPIDSKNEPRKRVEEVLSYLHSNATGKLILTTYEADKRIRFFSNGELSPLPVTPSWVPYFWITGSFLEQPWNSEKPIPEQTEKAILTWFPNSLTREF